MKEGKVVSTTEIEIESKAYGRTRIQERQRLEFPHGLYGFEQLRSFALLDSVHPPFYWLQSLEEVSTAFVLVNPYLVEPEYKLDILPSELEEIGSPDGTDLLVFSIVTIPQDDAPIRCNLQGPLIINRKERLGRQAISLDARWEIRHVLRATTAGR